MSEREVEEVAKLEAEYQKLAGAGDNIVSADILKAERAREGHRAELFNLLRRGILKPESAEERARQSGTGPLREEVDPSRFDAMRELAWTLPMAISWIAWRTPEAVRSAWDTYRLEVQCWQYGSRRRPLFGGQLFEVLHGYELVRRSPATVGKLAMEAAERVPAEGDGAVQAIYAQVAAAREELREKLAAGLLSADATSNKTGEFVTIPNREWLNLHLALAAKPANQLAQGSAGGRAVYRDVRLSRIEVCGIWQSDASAGAQANVPVAVPPTQKAKPGAKPGYDWDIFAVELRQRVEELGIPGANNVDGWRSQADVARFLQKLAQRDRKDLPFDTAKQRARRMMQELVKNYASSGDQ